MMPMITPKLGYLGQPQKHLLLLPSREEQILAVIRGVGGGMAGLSEDFQQSGFMEAYPAFCDIGTVMRSFMAWRAVESAIEVRYDRLMACVSSGEWSVSVGEAQRIFCHIGVKVSDDDAARMLEKAVASDTLTSNVKKPGRWSEKFSPRIEGAFRAVCGNELVAAGFESNENWRA